MSMHIFVYSDSPDFHELLEAKCSEFGEDAIQCFSTLDDMKSRLAKVPHVDLLIINDPKSEQLRQELVSFFVVENSHLKKIFVVSDKWRTEGNVKSFARSKSSDLFNEIRDILKSKIGDSTGWSAVSMATLVHFKSLPFDLFVRLSSDRYVKRIPAHEEISTETFINFRSKGITELFCERKHNRDFSLLLINNMINRVERDYDSVEEKIKANHEVFMTTRDIIHHLGISNRVIEVCESVIDRLIRDISMEQDMFGKYLRNLKHNPKLSFQFKLVELTSFIAGHLIQEMNASNCAHQIKTLIYASFFSDMGLGHPDQIHYRKAHQFENLSQEKQDEINFHALKASEMISALSDMSEEVAILVKEHHGSVSGIGFSSSLRPSDVMPLSRVLIISQSLAYDIISDGETSALEVLGVFVKKHDASGLQELLEILERSFGKKLYNSA